MHGPVSMRSKQNLKKYETFYFKTSVTKLNCTRANNKVTTQSTLNNHVIASEALKPERFTPGKGLRIIRIIIREAVMIEHELGNWKDFIEDMLRK